MQKDGGHVNVSAVIVAAGMSSRMGEFKPMKKIGDMTAVERMINTFQQAGVDMVVIVTGHEANLLEEHIARGHAPLICLRNENFRQTEMFDSACIGFRYLSDKSDAVLFTPVDVPLFTVNTVRALLASGADIAVPLYRDQEGHPVVFRNRVLPVLLRDSGKDGLKGAIRRSGFAKQVVPVEDEGTVLDMDTQADYQRLADLHNRQSLRPHAQIILAGRKNFSARGRRICWQRSRRRGRSKKPAH